VMCEAFGGLCVWKIVLVKEQTKRELLANATMLVL
jgi:hypothetical protein